jgi:methylmalonyl-CoA mutase
VGTIQYPDPGEKIAPDSVPVLRDDSAVMAGQTETEPVKLFRASEELEKIRMAAGSAAVKPSVFLLKIGDRTVRQARSQFSSGFFGCAGYTILDNEGFENIDDGVKAALDSNADIVVICSSDAEYPAFAPEIFSRLNGSAIVVIAGDPECGDSLRSKGLEEYIHLKSDLVETLRYYNSKFGLVQ